MQGFFSALQFLTIIPVRSRIPDARSISASLAWFPVVGAIIGIALAIAGISLKYMQFPALSIDVITVILLILITGGMHSDGLSDTCDAVFSGKNKEEMLQIMRDPHAGVMGVLALTSAILLKIALLYSVALIFQPQVLILMCVLSRWSLVFLMFNFSYARHEGKAKIHIAAAGRANFTLSTFICAFLTIILCSLKGIIVFFAVLFCAYLIGRFFYRKLGGMTGDTLGAANEMIEILVLLLASIIEKMASF